jgi:3-dehydroshikimate dehydratase
MVRISAFSDEVVNSFEEQLKFLQSQNIKYIEVRFLDGKNILDLSQEELSVTKKLLNAYSIEVSAIGSPIGKVQLEKDFETHFDDFKRAVEIADYLNSSLIRIFSYYAPVGKSIEDFKEEVIYRMQRKVDYLKDSNITLIHENEANIYGHNAINCAYLMDSIKSPHLKLAYDPANFVWGENIIDNIYQCWPLMKSHVLHIHIKDWKIGKNVGSIPGEGDAQIPELINELAHMNYSGFITMEPHLNIGGQFGGETSPELFSLAIDRVKLMCKNSNLSIDI